MGAVSLLADMNERPKNGKALGKMLDAHKAWLCCLIALAGALVSFRHDPLMIELIPILFSLAGVVFGVRALTRGPLRALGGAFLVVNAFLFVASIGVLIFLPR